MSSQPKLELDQEIQKQVHQLKSLTLTTDGRGETLDVEKHLYIKENILVCSLPGKFMMQVLPPCGHAVQEDKPDKVRKRVIKLS